LGDSGCNLPGGTAVCWPAGDPHATGRDVFDDAG